MVVAITALVVACAGTATAASVLIRSSSQIGNGVITATNIHAGTITGRQIEKGAVGANQIADSSIGTTKLSASVVKSISSAGGASALEWDRLDGPANVAAGQPSQRVMTVDNIPPGVYAIFAKTILSDNNPGGSLFEFVPTADAHCTITTEADVDNGRSVIGGSFFTGPADVAMQITHTFGGTGTILLDCDSSAAWSASDSSIIAIKLSSAPKMAVTS